MPSKTYRFAICDRDGGNAEDLVNVGERSVTLIQNGMATAAFRMRLDNLAAPAILGAANPDTRLVKLLKVYRNNVLLFIGPIVAASESASGEGGVIGVTAADPLWTLQRRLFGKSVDANTRGVGYTEGTSLSPVDLGSIAQHLIENANADASFGAAERDTGIRTLNAWVTASSNDFVGPWYFKPVSEAILEMSAMLTGYDFRLIYVEPLIDAQGVKLAEFHAAASMAVARDEVIFEYGTGKRNMKGYNRPLTLDGGANVTYALPSGFPDSHPAGQAPIVNNNSTATSRAARGVLEAVVSSDLAVDSNRQALVNEHARIRQNPREQVTFEVKSDVEYDYGTDFTVGDIITGRAKIGDSTRFDALFRIYGVTLSPSNEGTETLSLTVLPS